MFFSLSLYFQGEITNDTVEKVIEETAAVSSSPDELTQTDVENIALIIQNITNLQIGEPKVRFQRQ